MKYEKLNNWLVLYFEKLNDMQSICNVGDDVHSSIRSTKDKAIMCSSIILRGNVSTDDIMFIHHACTKSFGMSQILADDYLGIFGGSND